VHKLCEKIEHGRGTAEDLALLDDVPSLMEGQTICAFADAAAWPIQGLLKHFRADFQAHIDEKKCPFSESFEL
jgi:NADH-quinone oxidoreductase subunit F